MEPEETKVCANCKREIPVSNLTIHVVHCARNISVCAVCKEPVPRAQLQEHHDTFHKLLPCKQCGESVCGTDLEDHIRDSCANTIKSCRFCELELPRREIPLHEGYCGVRTEQCPACKEWVMIKYRQLHLDSNHGFIRLNDDPAPVAKKDFLASSNNGVLKLRTASNLSGNANPGSSRSASNLNRPNAQASRTEVKNNCDNGTRAANDPSQRPSSSGIVRNLPNPESQNNRNGVIVHDGPGKTDGKSSHRGAIKKRPAPKPPTTDPQRDLPYYSAAQRQQREEQQRQEQTAYNLSVGLPPVLSPAAKLDKLRKMDALHNREVVEPDYSDRLRGRVWMPADINPGNILGSARTSQDDDPLENNITKDEFNVDEEDIKRRKQEFKNLKPMSPQEFMERFNQLQLGNFGPGRGQKRVTEVRGDGQRNEVQQADVQERGKDRFSEIKTSLRELRRGLNEVTAPYNSTSNAPVRPPSPMVQDNVLADAVCIPCEFCTELIPVDDLVQHQTGCRPDLAQYKVRSPSRSPRASASPPPQRPLSDNYNEPVIPCEFCTQSLPIYLITEHQERCGREANLLYPD